MLLLVDQMDVENHLYLEYLVHYGLFKVVHYIDLLLINYFIFHKDPIYHLVH